jgi:sugar phosphate isomerase/epimerase
MGVQSYSFRKFSVDEALRMTKEAGLKAIEFCAVHVPCEPAWEGLEALRQMLAQLGIAAPSFGVESFGSDHSANRRKFVFAQQLGVAVLTADPDPDAIVELDGLAEEFGILIAIHNHGPESRYATSEDVLAVVRRASSRIGACVDFGHAIRAGESPDHMVNALGERVLSLHLKDWKAGGEETTLGEGDADLPAVKKTLDDIGFAGPVVLEFENTPEDPLPGVKKGWQNWLNIGP